jgi:hypothetical protein
VMLNRLIALKQGINHTLMTYYQGDVLEATKVFNKTLHSAFFHSMSQPDFKLPINHEFYRARINEEKDFTRADLFHIPFEKRYKVSTNRYSVPGLPALYMGGSVYVCWEEFKRHRFRDMYFARLVSTQELDIIRILRIPDFVKELETKEIADAIHHIWQYIGIFPITIACTICVEHSNEPFKPEYIIPQLLLRYVTDDKKLDGVMYPSTKTDYAKVQNVSAYNYVFPVKTVNKVGYCSQLKKNFAISEPTSVELEELLFKTDQLFGGGFPDASEVSITPQLINSPYAEKVLNLRINT